MFFKERGLCLKNNKRSFLIGGLTVAFVCALFASLLATRSFSPAEGWYSYSAYIINEQGEIPYVDFELLFPPLYTYIIALFTSIFGYNIIALRILGVVLFTLTGVFAYLIFQRLTKSSVFATLAGLLTVAVLQSEVVQIFYDYIRFMDLSAYATIYFLLISVEKIETRGKIRAYEPSLIAGFIFATATSMFKQSSGLILLLYTFIFFVFAAIVIPKNAKQYLKSLATGLGIAGVLYGAMFYFLSTQGALENYFYYNFKAATAAKGGSIFAILFGWIPRSVLHIVMGIVGVAIIALLLYLCIRISKKHPETEEDAKPASRKTVLLFALGFVAIFVLFSLLYKYLSFAFTALLAWEMVTAFLLATALFACVAIYLIIMRVKKKDYDRRLPVFCFFVGAVFVLAYSVCTSGGVVESQTALAYPLIFMLFIPVLKFAGKQLVALAIAVLMLLNIGLSFERKVVEMYSWWGLSVGSAFEMTETTSIPELAGIKMSKPYADMYQNVVDTVKENTNEGDEIFVFPHMPVLYIFCDRPRATNTFIQWFDVSTDAAVRSDIDVIKEKKPKALVILNIDDYVINAHESNFRQNESSGLSDMQRFLADFVVDEGYTKMTSDTISQGYTVEVWCKK